MDFSALTVSELKAFLRIRGKKCSGNRSELIRLCNLFKDSCVLDTSPSALEKDLTEQRKRFDDPKLTWRDILASKVSVSTGFSVQTIDAFLTRSLIITGNNNIAADAGTLKPARKGRMLYSSEKVQLCQVSNNSASSLFFRCQMEASLRDKLRFPCVQLSKDDGNIILSRCDCEQNADGRCSHVACLLYLIEDFCTWSNTKTDDCLHVKTNDLGKRLKKIKKPNSSSLRQLFKEKKIRQLVQLGSKASNSPVKHTTTV